MSSRPICAIFRRWRERRHRKIAIRELRTIDDRTLKDMGLTRGEIVAAVDGRVYRGGRHRPEEHTPPSPPSPEPARVEALDAAPLQGHLDRARQLRAESMVALLRCGLSGIVPLLRRAIATSPPSKPTCRPTCRGPDFPDRLSGRAGTERAPVGGRAP